MRIRRASRPGRILAVLLLLAAQLAVGISVHHHSSNVFEGIDHDESASPREVHDVGCAHPTASHWHRDRVVEVEPCLACLRQHLVGVRVHAPMGPTLAASAAVSPRPGQHAVGGFQLDPFPRGPPTLL